MFRLHVPHRKWEKEQIISVETIPEVVEELWKWLPEIINQEHIIIEYKDRPHNNPLNSEREKQS